jgi:hypothetical protein
MPPIVDSGLPPRQAFELRRENTGSLAAKIRPSGFLTLAAHSIFNCDIRLFWRVPFAVCPAKQAFIFERVFQNSGIYENRMRCLATEASKNSIVAYLVVKETAAHIETFNSLKQCEETVNDGEYSNFCTDVQILFLATC